MVLHLELLVVLHLLLMVVLRGLASLPQYDTLLLPDEIVDIPSIYSKFSTKQLRHYAPLSFPVDLHPIFCRSDGSLQKTLRLHELWKPPLTMLQP